MGEFYVRTGPVSYLQADGTLGFGATAAVFKTKAAALKAWADCWESLAVTVIEGPHDEVAPTRAVEPTKTSKKKKRGRRE